MEGGDAIVRLISASPNDHGYYGYRIERVSRGFSPSELVALYGPGPEAVNGNDPESTCGANDLQDAKCFEGSQPDVYDRARSVARIVMDASALCTGWLVSCDDHLLTNNHCTWDDNDFDTQGELNRMEWQFMYQDATCGGGSPAFEDSFMGGTWLENNANLDYTLVQAPVAENPAATYGWLLLVIAPPSSVSRCMCSGIRPAAPNRASPPSPATQAACAACCQLESPCRRLRPKSVTPATGGGNSGSPVWPVNHKVIALHHCGSCNNKGWPFQRIQLFNNRRQSCPPAPPTMPWAQWSWMGGCLRARIPSASK